jgi:hypothetical protein
MLTKLKEHIYQNIEKWSINKSHNHELFPLLKFNKEANGLVQKNQIGTVYFWFSNKSKYPLLITKLMNNHLSLEEMKEIIA